MAGSSVIGALRVVLGADTAALDKGLKDSQANVTAFGNAVQIGLAAVATAAIAAAGALGIAIKGAIDTADQLNKMSQSTGLSTEQLSKLNYAAELSDISTESLGKSMGKLSKALVSAGTDGAGTAGRAFAAMGIEVKNASDGSLRSSGDVILDLADKFSGYKDGAEKTSLAIQLFGKAGAAMIPLLNQGRDGLQEAGDEAAKFGLVLDKNTTMAAEAFNDNLKKMDKIKQGLVMTMTAQLLPTFEHLSVVMLESRKNTELMSGVADGLAFAIKGAVTVGLSAVVVFQRLGAEIVAFWNVLNAPDWTSLKAAWADFGNQEKLTDDAMKGLNATISNLWASTKTGADQASVSWDTQLISVKSMQRQVALLGDTWKATAPSIGEADTATKNALQSFLNSQAKRVASQTAESETVGKSVGDQAKLKVAYEANAIALANNIPLNTANNLLIAQAGDAAALAAMKVAGAQATLTAMNPAQQFQMQMTQLQQLYAAGTISLETFGARQQQIAEAAGATWDIAGASIAGSFATISAAFGKESSAMATAAKVFGVIQGTISMFTGAAKALELPFPANIAAVAAVLAKGASLVASIKGQSVPTGMMTGGAMTVKGSGGPDSVPVSLMASPGEQIDVWRPDQGGGSDPRRGSGGGNVVNLSMPIAVTRDAFRSLMEGINDMMADGYKLNVVPA